MGPAQARGMFLVLLSLVVSSAVAAGRGLDSKLDDVASDYGAADARVVLHGQRRLQALPTCSPTCGVGHCCNGTTPASNFCQDNNFQCCGTSTQGCLAAGNHCCKPTGVTQTGYCESNTYQCCGNTPNSCLAVGNHCCPPFKTAPAFCQSNTYQCCGDTTTCLAVGNHCCPAYKTALPYCQSNTYQCCGDTTTCLAVGSKCCKYADGTQICKSSGFSC